jgi:hypothetical protein
MRIVVIPAMTLANPYGDSEWRGFMSWIEAVLSVHKDLFVYMIVPQEVEKKLEPPPDRVEYVFEGKIGLFYTVEADAPKSFMELFNALTGVKAIDAVLTSRTPACGVMSRLLWDPRFEELIPIVLEESKAVDYGEGHQSVMEQELVGRTLGYMCSWPVLHSQFELDTAMNAARRFLSPSAVRKVMDRAVVIPRYLETEKIDRATAGMKKADTFTVFFGGRVNEAKQAEAMLETYDKFFRFGRDVKVLLSSPRAEAFTLQKYRKKYPEVEWLTNMRPEEFWAKAATAHVYLNTSRMEGFPIGFVEQLYIDGLVGIFPAADWTRGVLGDDLVSKYRFAYGSLELAATYLRHVYENYAESVEQTGWLHDILKEKFAKMDVCEALYTRIEHAVASCQSKVRLSDNAKELLLKGLAKLKEPFTLADAYQAMCDESMWYRGKPARGQAGPFMVYKWLCLNGYKDDCQRGEPVFRRIDGQKSQV